MLVEHIYPFKVRGVYPLIVALDTNVLHALDVAKTLKGLTF